MIRGWEGERGGRELALDGRGLGCQSVLHSCVVWEVVECWRGVHEHFFTINCG